MQRRDFLKSAALGATSAAAQPARRNIVFVLADDHRYDFIGALGHPWLKGLTPNLDRMVRQGVN
ncbi:MAG: twin-arginine translocation signal domain-containing protein, partial [Bryobacteraceae bacterium]